MKSSKARRKKVGLALSGGAARGLAHVGVLRVLQKEGIPIDLIAGTSAGAVIGAGYAWDQDMTRITREALDADWKKMAPMIDLSLPKSGFIKGKKVQELIAGYVGGNIKFSDLSIPFACVATDIDTGEEIVINSGSVPEALRASISIPGIFTVVKYEGRYLVDGGLTTPVPVEVVRDMGADFIIAVNVNPDVTDRLGKTSQKRVAARKEPNIFQIMMQSVYITTYSLARGSLENADIVIEPDLAHINAGDFNKAKELITRGRQAAEEAVPEIKRKLENL
ncbi:MAG: patatin-like phospholipase family protein [Dehalococcoidales bacterium]|nr:patatin-like phospholipase family protein [Dehalococcoidales bacterium]